MEAALFTVEVKFTADPPTFESAALSAPPITCSQKDTEWRFKLPAVTNADILPTTIELLTSATYSELFTLDGGVVKLQGSALAQLIFGKNCPQTSTISLEFKLSNEFIGENTQTI